ncbi:hypothetical protein EUTSA_v10015151mg [Eutrema salsugineum]|uniref:Uncharacterized protein n=1 Tax=Eutrema salsugineum TaxID=72664 RepID=V4LM90_EUTSA|nr:hypothetical protein EUTSA_v10015151mg [Eutrema salsugineum]
MVLVYSPLYMFLRVQHGTSFGRCRYRSVSVKNRPYVFPNYAGNFILQEEEVAVVFVFDVDYTCAIGSGKFNKPKAIIARRCILHVA